MQVRGQFHTSAEQNLRTHWTRSDMGPKADPDAVAKRKIFDLCQQSNLGYSANSLLVMTALFQLPKNIGTTHW
jgi:hypothetical protein